MTTGLQYPHLFQFHQPAQQNNNGEQVMTTCQNFQQQQQQIQVAKASYLVIKNEQHSNDNTDLPTPAPKSCSSSSAATHRRVSKPKKYRRAVFTDHQRHCLEEEFRNGMYISTQRKCELAKLVGLSDRQVKVWFQNRRAVDIKAKRQQGQPCQQYAGQDQQQHHHFDVNSFASDEQEAAIAMTMLPDIATFLQNDRSYGFVTDDGALPITVGVDTYPSYPSSISDENEDDGIKG